MTFVFPRSAVLAIAIASSAIVASQSVSASPVQMASLGDLSSYKAIASDTLAAADKGDLSVAQKRGTDLETAWDKAEDKLKPQDPARWRVIDKAIDRVLNALRAAKPEQPKITAALHDLLTTLDASGAS